MFDGFEEANVDVGETTIFIRRKGEGSPLMLLHGFPETHLMWRDVAPALAQRFTVVCADLRGYGASGKPPSDARHTPYAKRAMALDMLRVMETLGFPRFAVAGHDRGGRVAYRMALDHPDRVTRLAVLDIVPTLDVLERVEATLMLGYWPWSLLAQPTPFPEQLMHAAPQAFVDAALDHWGSGHNSYPREVREAYVASLRDPESGHAICEEYRAATTLDLEYDRADQAAGRRIACPVLALWAAHGAIDTLYSATGGPLSIWRRWTEHDVSGRALSGGHFFAEQNPSETITELEKFFAA